MGNEHITIVGILGTVRPGNYTSKALAVVGDEGAKAGATWARIDAAGRGRGRPGGPVPGGRSSMPTRRVWTRPLQRSAPTGPRCCRAPST